jgi:hypothetical protein
MVGDSEWAASGAQKDRGTGFAVVLHQLIETTA